MLIKTAEDILANATWPRDHQLNFDLYSPMLDRTFLVSLYFDPQREQKEIRDLTLTSIQEFQNLKKESIDELYDAMWEHLKDLHKTHKYSIDKGKTWQESKLADNLAYLGINNKEEAIAKSPITGVGFINEDDIDHSYFTIFMSPEWDQEHGMSGYYYHGKLDYVE